jgi:hypothetical protein
MLLRTLWSLAVTLSIVVAWASSHQLSTCFASATPSDVQSEAAAAGATFDDLSLLHNSEPQTSPLLCTCRQLPNGNLEVGVHIADVTHFLLPDTAMDLEAALRATTTYLVQRRIDMLPKPLTEDICSLRCAATSAM